MAKRRPNLYYRLEYLAFRVVEIIVRSISIETAVAFSRFIGLVWWYFDKRHRQIADLPTEAS